MTYRERRLRRAERLREWSAGNQAKSEQRGAAADEIMSHIPPGQPILVGHHSERRHRKDLARIQDGISASVELGAKAEAQERAADEIEAQADNAIYDDDPDAIQRLSDKIAKGEIDLQTPGLSAHLWQTTMDKLAVDQPNYASYKRELGRKGS